MDSDRRSGFRVDTHVFRELGELLVGRDSTALNELVKNSYDADASEIIVHGEWLDDPERARIVVTDDGHGMTDGVLERGFLTVASRFKDAGPRRSPKFGRRLTGAKGVGRLAAQKLARQVRVDTTPDVAVFGADGFGGSLLIDWAEIERLNYVEDIYGSGAVLLRPDKSNGGAPGTRIALSAFRRAWSARERASVVRELGSFRPPAELLEVPTAVVERNSLLGMVRPADSDVKDPGCVVRYSGDLEVGSSFYDRLLIDALWMIEVDASGPVVRYQITPTVAGEAKLGANARNWTGEIPHPSPDNGPHFVSRIFIREGAPKGGGPAAEWVRNQGGIRVYVEGFRVLPYGEPGDDWLELDREYTRRSTSDLPFLEEFRQKIKTSSKTELKPGRTSLLVLPNKQYTGAVFLREERLGGLRMVVNREGFVADEAWAIVRSLVRVGIDISVRHRAAVAPPKPPKSTGGSATPTTVAVGTTAATTSSNPPGSAAPVPEATAVRPQSNSGAFTPPVAEPWPGANTAGSGSEPALGTDLTELEEGEPGERLHRAARFAREALARNDLGAAAASLAAVEDIIEPPVEQVDPVEERRHLSMVLESLGLQLHAFVHEINAALAMVTSLSGALSTLRAEAQRYTRHLDPRVSRLEASLSELRQHLERQASVLIDVTGPDSRRRRARLSLSERFQVAQGLLAQVAARRGVSITNEIPSELRSPPMFSAELTMLFTNLLSNAVKAAGHEGKVLAVGAREGNSVVVRIENTGVRVDLADAERWFQPFESTTVRPDPILGQGMGMGLPISRRIVDSYRGELTFVPPSEGFATAVALRLPAE